MAVGPCGGLAQPPVYVSIQVEARFFSPPEESYVSVVMSVKDGEEKVLTNPFVDEQAVRDFSHGKRPICLPGFGHPAIKSQSCRDGGHGLISNG